MILDSLSTLQFPSHAITVRMLAQHHGYVRALGDGACSGSILIEVELLIDEFRPCWQVCLEKSQT